MDRKNDHFIVHFKFSILDFRQYAVLVQTDNLPQEVIDLFNAM